MRNAWIGFGALLALVAVAGSGSALAECEHPVPLDVVSSTLAGDTLEASVANPTSSALSGYLYGTVQAGGRTIHFYGPVTVGALSTETYVVSFGTSITLLDGLGVCGDIPWGVSDTADPIVVVPKKKDDPDP